MSKISVVISAYNEAERIARSVESILTQSWENFELIVINDGSTDMTLPILKSYKDPRLRIISQQNKGLYPALNRGLSLATGHFIARQDADDYSKPNRLENQVDFLEANPDVALVGTAYQAFDVDGKQLFKRHFPLNDADIRRDFAKYIPFCHSSVMIRRRALEVVGPYREDLDHFVDWELWIRIAKEYRVANLDESLVFHLTSPNTYFAREFTRLQKLRTNVRMSMLAIRELQLSRFNYLHSFAKSLYPFLPERVRRFARSMISHIREEAPVDNLPNISLKT